MEDTSTDGIATPDIVRPQLPLGRSLPTQEPARISADGSDADAEHRRADEVRARLAAIVESSEDAIIGKTLDGVITDWNRGAERLYGYSVEEAVGKSIELVVPPKYVPELASIHAKLRRGERVERFETVRRTKSGARVLVSVTMSPIADSAGRIIGAATIARDITPIRHAQEAQRFLGEVSRSLSTSLDYGATLEAIARVAVPTLADMCVVDMIEENSVRQRATSHVEDSHDDTLSEILAHYPLDAEEHHPVWEVLRTGEPQLITMLDLPCSGWRSSEVIFRLCEAGVKAFMAVPIVIRGRPAGAISLVSIDSRRSYGPDELVLATELASRASVAVDNATLYRESKAAVKARDDFLSMAAHELRTPITGLRGFVQLALRQLERDGELDALQARQALKVIDIQSRKLSNLVSQLLDVTRLEAGRLSLERRFVDIGYLVESMVGATMAADNEHEITLRIPSPVLALVDPMRIEQVVAGLLDNAVKFSPPGTVIDVDLVQSSRDAFSLVVRDHGPGVPPEQRSNIFTRFYHGHPTDQTGGMGLGLYISREIVVLHGGTIEAEFPADGGSKFTVTLPTWLGEASSCGSS